MPRKTGPPPKPTATKLLHGTFRKDRAPKHEAKPKPKIPSCPAWLGVDAKREWRRIAPLLLQQGLLTRLDRAVLVGYCAAWATFMQATKALRDAKDLTATTTQGVSVSAMYRVRESSSKELLRYAAEFGLSPSARTRIEAESVDPEDAEEATAQKLLGG